MGIISAIGGLLKVIGKALGIYDFLQKKKAGRDEQALDQHKEGENARKRMGRVRPVTKRGVRKRLRKGTF